MLSAALLAGRTAFGGLWYERLEQQYTPATADAEASRLRFLGVRRITAAVGVVADATLPSLECEARLSSSELYPGFLASSAVLAARGTCSPACPAR